MEELASEEEEEEEEGEALAAVAAPGLRSAGMRTLRMRPQLEEGEQAVGPQAGASASWPLGQGCAGAASSLGM